MIKKRSRPQTRIREPEPDVEDASKASDDVPSDGDEPNLPLADLIELRALRRTRQGIDATKLVVGDARRKRRRAEEAEEEGEAEKGGLRAGAPEVRIDDEDDSDKEDDVGARARKSVRSNNFTQQTNVLDVDKHMMAYIEENMKKRRGAPDAPATVDPADPYAELHRLADKYKRKQAGKEEEGSVAGSLAMLTAIPEVDLGMDARLKNIEDTEKAKRELVETKKNPASRRSDEVSTRFFQPNQRPKSDADLIEDARREAMGLPPQDDVRRRNPERNQTATDEYVMEKFKKRMRK